MPVWSQRQSLSISNASILVSLATFALQLVKELLQSLLENEDYQFRDTRVAATLLRVHMVICSAPYSTVASSAAHEVRIGYKVARYKRKILLIEPPMMGEVEEFKDALCFLILSSEVIISYLTELQRNDSNHFRPSIHAGSDSLSTYKSFHRLHSPLLDFY